MSIYKVKKPIAGFKEIEEVELNKNDGISAIVKSTSDEPFELTLLHTYYQKGDFEIPSSVKALLDIAEDTNLSVYLVVILNKEVSDSTINLGAPLIFNEDNNTMAQAIINTEVGTISELFKVEN